MQPKSKPENESQVSSETVARRPYKKPELRRLGSVRDLTLGSMGPLSDSVGTRNTKKNM